MGIVLTTPDAEILLRVYKDEGKAVRKIAALEALHSDWMRLLERHC